MKPTPKSSRRSEPPVSVVAFGAHPDDVEFGCGGVIAAETFAGRSAHLVVCSRGESGTHGTAKQRVAEARAAADALGASVEFLGLDGDAHFERRVGHALTLAAVLRRRRPSVVLAPSVVENQHPDHAVLGALVRNAARLARYGGVAELKQLPPHSIAALYFYAVSPDAEPRDISPVFVDVSDPVVLGAWRRSIEAHASQLETRDYAELVLTRARAHGLRCGAGHAVPLFPNDPPVVGSLAALARTARSF